MQVLEIGAFTRAAEAFAFRHVFGHLDLDAVRAPVGELTHAGRTGAHACEIQHGEARKRRRSARKGHTKFRRMILTPGQSSKSGGFVYRLCTLRYTRPKLLLFNLGAATAAHH